jgi:hypothetical protein
MQKVDTLRPAMKYPGYEVVLAQASFQAPFDGASPCRPAIGRRADEAAMLNRTTGDSYTAALAVKSPLAPLWQRGDRKRSLSERGPRTARGDFCGTPCQSGVV